MEKKKENTPERGKEEMAEGMDHTLKEFVAKREDIEKEYNLILTQLNELLIHYKAVADERRVVAKREETEKEYTHILTQLNELLIHYKAVADERRMGNPLMELQEFFQELTRKRESSPPPTPPIVEPEGIKAPPPFTPPPLPWLKRVVRDVLRRIAWFFIRWHYRELQAHISCVAQKIQQQVEFQSQKLQRVEELSSLQYAAQKLEVRLMSDIVKVTQQTADTQRDYDEYLIDLFKRLFPLIDTQRDYDEYLINIFKKLLPLIDTKDSETTYLVTRLPIERVDVVLEEFSKKQEHLHQIVIKQREELDRLLLSLGDEKTK